MHKLLWKSTFCWWPRLWSPWDNSHVESSLTSMLGTQKRHFRTLRKMKGPQKSTKCWDHCLIIVGCWVWFKKSCAIVRILETYLWARLQSSSAQTMSMWFHCSCRLLRFINLSSVMRTWCRPHTRYSDATTSTLACRAAKDLGEHSCLCVLTLCLQLSSMPLTRSFPKPAYEIWGCICIRNGEPTVHHFLMDAGCGFVL